MGLDAAGKTTILYKLKLGEIVTTIPTIGQRGAGGRCVNVSPVYCFHMCHKCFRLLELHWSYDTRGIVFNKPFISLNLVGLSSETWFTFMNL